MRNQTKKEQPFLHLGSRRDGDKTMQRRGREKEEDTDKSLLKMVYMFRGRLFFEGSEEAKTSWLKTGMYAIFILTCRMDIQYL